MANEQANAAPEREGKVDKQMHFIMDIVSFTLPNPFLSLSLSLFNIKWGEMMLKY